MHFNREIRCFLGAILCSQGCEHIPLGSDAKPCPSSLYGFFPDILPEISFTVFQIIVFGIRIDLGKDLVNFFKLKVDDVIHDPLCFLDMVDEKTGIKTCFRSKRFFNVAVKVDCEQTATVVCT